jgi:transcriptional regulator with XRE-family HTH domain
MVSLSATTYNRLVATELRLERERKHMTIEQLVRSSDMNRSTLLRYLYNERALPVPALYRIADALSVEPYELMARASARLAVEQAVGRA